MLAAALLMPIAFLLKGIQEYATLSILLISMALEIIGLIFVIVHIIRQRKLNHNKS